MLILLTCFPVRHRSVPLLHYYSKLVADYDKVWFKWWLFLEKNNDTTIKKLFCYKNEFLYMLYFMCIACANRKNIFAFAFCFLICKPTIPSISPPLLQTFTIPRSAGERGISLTPLYQIQPLHRHLDITRNITAESSTLN